MNERLLLVDDDRELRAAIESTLRQEGYEVRTAPDGIQANQFLHAEKFDAVLLDLGLPFVDGWNILRQIEEHPIPPVIVISARGAEGDKVKALDLGADDYLTKPFGAEELLARIRAVLRRTQTKSKRRERTACNDVVVDFASRAVSRRGQEVRLTPTEWALLSVLAENTGRAMEHRTLLARVWGPEYVGDRQYLRTFIQRLRLKLEDDPADPKIIETVGRMGYRFGPAETL